MKIISSKVHGILDYITVIFLALSPTLFHMEGNLKNFMYGLAIVHLLLTILTRFEFGIIKLIPFKVHGLIELVVAVALAAAAFWFYHNNNTLGFYFYIWLAIVISIVFLLTDFGSGKQTTYTT